MGEEMGDLGDIVVSWSVEEIIDDDLYRGQVRDRFRCVDLCMRPFFPRLREVVILRGPGACADAVETSLCDLSLNSGARRRCAVVRRQRRRRRR
jgi:hypothetical protein